MDIPLPQVFGSKTFRKKMLRLLKRFHDIFAIELPAEPAKITPMNFKIDKKGWRSDKRTRQYPRPLSRGKSSGYARNSCFREIASSQGPTRYDTNWS